MHDPMVDYYQQAYLKMNAIADFVAHFVLILLVLLNPDPSIRLSFIVVEIIITHGT